MANQVPISSNSSMKEILRHAIAEKNENLDNMTIGYNCLFSDPQAEYHLGRLRDAYNDLIISIDSANRSPIDPASNFLKLAHRIAVRLVKERSAGTEKKPEDNENNVPVFSISDFVSVFGLTVSGVKMLANRGNRTIEHIADECVKGKRGSIDNSLHRFVKEKVQHCKNVNKGKLRYRNALSLAYHHDKHAVKLAQTLQVRDEPTAEWYLQKTRELYRDIDKTRHKISGGDVNQTFHHPRFNVRIGTYTKEGNDTVFTTCFVFLWICKDKCPYTYSQYTYKVVEPPEPVQQSRCRQTIEPAPSSPKTEVTENRATSQCKPLASLLNH